MTQTHGKRKKLQNALLLTFIIWAAAMVARAAPTDQTLRDAIAGADDSTFDQPDTLALLRYGLPPRPRIKPGQTGKPAGTLSTDNADIYRKIFALQEAGDWKQADALTGKLTDSRLTGHVLLQRYMKPGAPRASYEDLADWLDRYADLPGADRVYKMAQARKPKGLATAALRHPVRSGGINGYLDVFSDNSDGYIPHLPRTAAQKRLISRLDDRIADALAEGAPSRAYSALTDDPAAKLLDSVEYDQLRAQIASNFYYLGKADKALELATASAARSGNKAPLAGWTGGLAAWRQKDYKKAAGLFELAGASPYASDWMSAGGAYWAARMAYVERKRLKGAVFHGGNVHHGFQREWLLPAFTTGGATYLFGAANLLEARGQALGTKTLEEFLSAAPALSLKCGSARRRRRRRGWRRRRPPGRRPPHGRARPGAPGARPGPPPTPSPG